MELIKQNFEKWNVVIVIVIIIYFWNGVKNFTVWNYNMLFQNTILPSAAVAS